MISRHLCQAVLLVLVVAAGCSDTRQVELPEARAGTRPSAGSVEGVRDLTNTDLGLDRNKELNYFNDRIEHASVPGPVDPSAPVSILNAPAARPALPPAHRHGGTKRENVFLQAMEDAEDVGNIPGTLGGMGGMKARPPKKPVPPKAPTVWKRDAARPTFARVYVGDGNSLELVSLHVSVQVEGARARTLVDHVVRNPHDRQLEGTFEYPLPAGASPSYFAMFLGATRATPPARFRPPQAGKPPVLPEDFAPAQLARQVDVPDWGTLREARVVAPEKASEAYEEITRQKIDPALLEYAGGNTFRGRVFPIAARGYNRVLVAYEETLPVVEGRLVYRFSLPGTKVNEMRFALTADSAECKDATFLPREAKKADKGRRVAVSHTWSDTRPSGEVVFSARPANASIQATSGRHGEKGPCYLHARVRPDLPRAASEEPFARHAVFLLDTSLSEDRDRFNVSMKLLKAVLEKDDQIRSFNVLCFNAGAAWLSPKEWLPNTRAGREKALSLLDGILLEGATDLGGALDKLCAPPAAPGKGTPIACFLLSDGHLTWGETEVPPLVARFKGRCPFPTRFFCYRTGLGQENAELYDALTSDGGGTFQVFGEAEVAAAASAHRRQCLKVKKVTLEGASEVLVAGRRAAVYPGGELVITGHFAKACKAKVVVEGTFQGKDFKQEFPCEVKADGELAPRAWGEVAVASLLSLNDPWTERLVTAYCQHFNVASRAGSFLVLENDSDYKRFDIEDQKKQGTVKDVGEYLSQA